MYLSLIRDTKSNFISLLYERWPKKGNLALLHFLYFHFRLLHLFYSSFVRTFITNANRDSKKDFRYRYISCCGPLQNATANVVVDEDVLHEFVAFIVTKTVKFCRKIKSPDRQTRTATIFIFLWPRVFFLSALKQGRLLYLRNVCE